MNYKIITGGDKIMRVVIFTEVLSPYVCGISSYVEVLKKGLEDLSHQVLIVTSSLHTKKPVFKDGILRCPAKKSSNKFGYECKKIEDSKVFDFIYKFKPDVFHIHTDTKIGYMGLFIADKMNRPVVFTIHDFFMDRFASDKSNMIWRIRTYFEKRHFRDMLDNSDVITSSCERAKEFAAKADRNVDITVIPSNTDKIRFDYQGTPPQTIDKMREKLHLSRKATVAVFAGNLTVEKNIEFILGAFAKYIDRSDNIQLLIVGDGSETEYLKSVCKQFGINDRVRFSGEVAHSIMPEIYASCDMYVCSSDDSLMSMSVVEAISCGLPVLIKKDKEKYVYDMINDGVNGFVYTTQTDFIDKIKKLASFNSEQKKSLKNLVRRSYNDIQNYHMARYTVKSYEQALKKKSSNNIGH